MLGGAWSPPTRHAEQGSGADGQNGPGARVAPPPGPLTAGVRHQATAQGEDTISKTAKVTALLLMLLVAACASPQPPRSIVQVPDKLMPGANESLVMIVAAKGVQIYECRARPGQVGAYEWTFVAPEADLFDARGNRIGRHYAGPHWESTDGSRILGTVKERADAPVADAIPWLLLAAKSVGSEGSFSKVTSVQRVNTVGGVEPKAGCSQAAVGTPARTNYTADYYFFTAK
jgi:hypothetical protein